jgi:hypothetical protein
MKRDSIISWFSNLNDPIHALSGKEQINVLTGKKSSSFGPVGLDVFKRIGVKFELCLDTFITGKDINEVI